MNFNLCPICGGKNVEYKNMRKWVCADCGFDLYNNVASAVGLIIANSNGEILFEKRGKEPRKGFLALPGGFVDPDETAEEACLRECREELGVIPKNLKYAGSFPNTYEYKNFTYKTCDLFFEAELDGENFNPQEEEVSGLVRVPVKTKDDILNAPLAFESAKHILLKWLEAKK